MRGYKYIILTTLFVAFGCRVIWAQPPSNSSGRGANEQSSSIAAPITGSSLTLDNTRSQRTVIRSGRIVVEDIEASLRADSIERERLYIAAIQSIDISTADSLSLDSLFTLAHLPITQEGSDTLSRGEREVESLLEMHSVASLEEGKEKRIRTPYFNDSMSYRRVVGTSILLPGFGQVYNKQAWKLPIIYGAVAGSALLLHHENKTYIPVKKEYEDYTYTVMTRSDYLDELQAEYIRTSRRRNLYIGMITASAIYALGDAAVNYSVKDVSSIRKATTLSAICPGAGQIYNRSYWKIPFIVGGITTMIFVFDWNNRGYVRFSKAYELTYDYEQNPDDYPDGPLDEFNGRYSSTYMKSLRDSYRRNRDLSVIIAVGLYAFQIIDANVDAHLKDFDISNDLTMSLNPLLDYAYMPSSGSNSAIFGLNLGINF